MRALLLALGIPLLGASPPQDAPTPVDFDRQIRPLLSENCSHCHGPDAKQRKADLRLDTKEGAFSKVGEVFPIVPGKPDQSEVYRRIASKDRDEVMPPPKSNRKLTPAQVALVKRWIAEGADWKGHWSLTPPRRPEPPAVKHAAVRNPIDSFIIARLEKEGLAPSPEADKVTLIRRVTLDLTGLPPTPAEVDAFVADGAAGAYEKVVDRLLASPRFGEHQAWPWLSAARYSDTNGYQGDGTRTMWPWRDWIIDALNRNLPFDQFTVEQLAGDLLPNPTVAQRIATGFNRNHMLNGEGGRIAEESRVDYVADRVDTTATVWMGLTVGCARCHDHKYDPITQKEFYQLYAYFNNLPETGGVDRKGSANPVLEFPSPEQTEKIAAARKHLQSVEARSKEHEQKLRTEQPKWEQEAAASGKVPPPILELLKTAETQRSEKQAKELTDHYLANDPEQKKIADDLDKAKKALKSAQESVTLVMIMEERPKPRETKLLIRGAWDQYGEKVSPAVPASLPKLAPDAPPNRLALARWLVDPAHPLTARVTVNRFWQQYFGAGLVKTSEDFGTQGQRPSHPELLDWLATEFVRTGWDMKKMHRLVVTSGTYRQTSKVTPLLLERDAENRLLGRGPRFRLTSAMIRDQALFAGGLLVEKLGGPSVKTYQPPGIWEEMTFGIIKFQQDKGEALWRRSLYTFWRRTVGPTNLFDAASRQVCTVRPSRTNTPLHALTLLNDVTYVEASRALAQRMLKEGGATPRERLTFAFRTVLSRAPSAKELAILEARHRKLLERYGQDKDAAAKLLKAGESKRDEALDAAEMAANAGIASVLFNLDEAMTKE